MLSTQSGSNRAYFSTCSRRLSRTLHRWVFMINRKKKIKSYWTVVLVGTALGYSYETLTKGTDALSFYLSLIGFCICFIASYFSMKIWNTKSIDQYIRITFFYCLPAFFIPIIPLLNYNFPLFGLTGLVWPVLLAMYIVYNPRFLAWCKEENSEASH